MACCVCPRALLLYLCSLARRALRRLIRPTPLCSSQTLAIVLAVASVLFSAGGPLSLLYAGLVFVFVVKGSERGHRGALRAFSCCACLSAVCSTVLLIVALAAISPFVSCACSEECALDVYVRVRDAANATGALDSSPAAPAASPSPSPIPAPLDSASRALFDASPAFASWPSLAAAVVASSPPARMLLTRVHTQALPPPPVSTAPPKASSAGSSTGSPAGPAAGSPEGSPKGRDRDADDDEFRRKYGHRDADDDEDGDDDEDDEPLGGRDHWLFKLFGFRPSMLLDEREWMEQAERVCDASPLVAIGAVLYAFWIALHVAAWASSRALASHPWMIAADSARRARRAAARSAGVAPPWAPSAWAPPPPDAGAASGVAVGAYPAPISPGQPSPQLYAFIPGHGFVPVTAATVATAPAPAPAASAPATAWAPHAAPAAPPAAPPAASASQTLAPPPGWGPPTSAAAAPPSPPSGDGGFMGDIRAAFGGVTQRANWMRYPAWSRTARYEPVGGYSDEPPSPQPQQPQLHHAQTVQSGAPVRFD